MSERLSGMTPTSLRLDLLPVHKHKFQGEASNWGPLWGIRDGHITRQHTAFVNRSTPSGTNPWDDLSKCLPEVICGKTYVGRLACNDPASALPNAWETRMPLHPHPDKRLTLENELKKIFVFYASDLPREPRQAEMEAEQNMIDAVRGGFEATVHFFYHVDGSPGGGSQVTSPNAGSKGEATLSRSGLSFRRRKSKIMEKREEDIFDGVVKVLTFKGFIEMLADSDILGGDGEHQGRPPREGALLLMRRFSASFVLCCSICTSGLESAHCWLLAVGCWLTRDKQIERLFDF